MTLHRFFVPPEWIRENQVSLSGDVAHQIRNVLRLKTGDRIVVLDDTGWECEIELDQVERDEIDGQVVVERQSATEPRTRVTLYQAALKARKFEFVLQKGTELGVVEFVPLVCERTVVGDLSEIDTRQERWRRIVREAAEQSRRGRLPVLRPTAMFALACQESISGGALTLVLSEHEPQLTLRQAMERSAPDYREQHLAVSVFVGPEGGFSADEVYLAAQYGAQPVSLGPRILRAETAGLAAVASILYALEP